MTRLFLQKKNIVLLFAKQFDCLASFKFLISLPEFFLSLLASVSSSKSTRVLGCVKLGAELCVGQVAAHLLNSLKHKQFLI